MAKNEQNVTIYGRLSYPVFSHKAAVERNQKGKFPKDDPTKVAPEFHLLVEQAQLDKLVKHLEDVFIPYTVERSKAGEKRNALTQKEADRLLDWLANQDWELQPPYMPIKMVPEKTVDMAPEAVASIKVMGRQGEDLTLKAIVNEEDELVVPDSDILQFPIIKPLSATVHEMYGGCYVAATLNLYAFVSGKLPGISASAPTAVFKADGDRFGGSTEIDEDEIFAD